MKKTQAITSEYNKKSAAVLYKDLAEKRAELVKTKIAISLQKEKNLSVVKTIKTDIARILTIIRSKHE